MKIIILNENNNIENENNNIENENNNIENENNNIENENNNIENENNNIENENNNIENENDIVNEENNRINIKNNSIIPPTKDCPSTKFNLLEPSQNIEESEKIIYFNSNEFSSGKNKIQNEIFNSKSKTEKNHYSINKQGMSIEECENENKEVYKNSASNIQSQIKNIYVNKENMSLNAIEEEKYSINSQKDLTDESNQKSQNKSINKNDLNNGNNICEISNEIDTENLFVDEIKYEDKSNENYLSSNLFSKVDTIKKNEFNPDSQASKNQFIVDKPKNFNSDIVSSEYLNKNSNPKNEESSNQINNPPQYKYKSEMKKEKKILQTNLEKNQLKSDFNIKNSKVDKSISFYINYIKMIKQIIKKKIKDKVGEEEIQKFIKDTYQKKIVYCIERIKHFEYEKIKEKVCIYCEENTLKTLKLPCECKICDGTCLSNYFIDFCSLETINHYCCYICAIDYSPYYLYQLGLIFQKNNLEFLLEKLINLFNKNIDKECAFCKCQFGNKEKIKIKYENEKNDILGDYNKLIHFFCEDCFKKMKKNKFNCDFCKKIHLNINKDI